MNEYDTEIVLNLLKRAAKTTDWDLICEAIEYVEDVSDIDVEDDGEN